MPKALIIEGTVPGTAPRALPTALSLSLMLPVPPGRPTGQEWVRRGLLTATVLSPPTAPVAIDLLAGFLKLGTMPPARTLAIALLRRIAICICCAAHADADTVLLKFGGVIVESRPAHLPQPAQLVQPQAATSASPRRRHSCISAGALSCAFGCLSGSIIIRDHRAAGTGFLQAHLE